MTPFQKVVVECLIEQPMTEKELQGAVAKKLDRTLHQVGGALANSLAALYNKKVLRRNPRDLRWSVVKSS